METFSALLAICAGNSPVPGEFPAQRPVTRSFHVFFDLRLNNPLSKHSWGWWFETLWCPLWRHCNATMRPWLRSQQTKPNEAINYHNLSTPSDGSRGNVHSYNRQQYPFIHNKVVTSVVEAWDNKANLRDLIAATGLVILLKLDSNCRLISPCDLEILWTTSKNNMGPLRYHIKLCASFQMHR